GALAADTAFTGKASFGFVSRYEPGATTASGNKEFQFKFANIAFATTNYDRVVLSGARVRFNGSGTINGTGDYAFLLSALDGQQNGGGGLDKFRMKIFNKINGAVIYDNQKGDADTTVAQTVIGGGSGGVRPEGTSREDSPPRLGVQPSQGSTFEYALAQNAPNPFRGRTEIGFSLAERSQVRLTVYDVAGREVASLADGEWEPGPHSV